MWPIRAKPSLAIADKEVIPGFQTTHHKLLFVQTSLAGPMGGKIRPIKKMLLDGFTGSAFHLEFNGATIGRSRASTSRASKARKFVAGIAP
jgi:hypothetical protein